MSDLLDRTVDELERTRASRAVPPSAVDTTAEERAAFLARFPFEAFWADVQERAANAPAREIGEDVDGPRAGRPTFWERVRDWADGLFGDRRWAAAAATALVVVMAGGLWLAWPPSDDAGRTDVSAPPEGIRFRGPESPASSDATGPALEAGLQFFVRRESRTIPGAEGAVLQEGDRIGFKYWSGDNDYLVMLSIEESGQVTVYYPDGESGEDPGESIRILRGRNIPLDGSVVLNDYVGRERFFALFSKEPLAVADVRALAVRSFSGLEGAAQRDVRGLSRLPVDVPQATFWIEKQ